MRDFVARLVSAVRALDVPAGAVRGVLLLVNDVAGALDRRDDALHHVAGPSLAVLLVVLVVTCSWGFNQVLMSGISSFTGWLSTTLIASVDIRVGSRAITGWQT